MSLKNRNIPEDLREQGKHLSARFLDVCNSARINLSAYDLSATEVAWTTSPFIAENAIADPKWFIEEILDSPVSARPASYYREQVSTNLATAHNPTLAYSQLRTFRNREIARIAWRDIIGGVDVVDITAELSDFADACVAGAVPAAWPGGGRTYWRAPSSGRRCSHRTCLQRYSHCRTRTARAPRHHGAARRGTAMEQSHRDGSRGA